MANKNQFEPFVAPFRAGNIVIGLFFVLILLFLVAASLASLFAPVAHKASALAGTILLALGLTACGSSVQPAPSAQLTVQEKIATGKLYEQHYTGSDAAIRNFMIPDGHKQPASK